jgi:peptide/nickel transport system permease protein
VNDGEIVRLGPWRQAVARLRSRPLGVGALAFLAAVVAVGALAGEIAPYYPGREFVEYITRPQPPLTPHHLLGTDVLGRDFLTQLVYAIRETSLSALVCAGGATFAGVVVGALAGFYGGWFDEVVNWATRVVVAVPAIALLIVLAVWSTQPLSPLDDALWLMAIMWTSVARVVRASVASLRRNEYVEAAEASGSSGLRILVRHVLPNAAGAVIVAGTTVVGQAIVLIATVDYLGYGYNQPERPTLGGLVADATQATAASLGRAPSISDVWWLYAIPSALLVIVLLAVAFVGDALDDALNPATA